MGPTIDWGSITELNLSNCGIKELSLLEGFTSILYLSLDHNLLNDLNGVQCCTTLHTINLSHNRLHQNSEPGHVGRCLATLTELKGLDIESNNLTSIGALGLQNGMWVPLCKAGYGQTLLHLTFSPGRDFRARDASEKGGGRLEGVGASKQPKNQPPTTHSLRRGGGGIATKQQPAQGFQTT